MTKQKVVQRRDGARNREKVLEAAGAIMRERGADAPFEAIAERAGVTRTTIYRNFDNRFELYAAVLDREVELIRQDLEARDQSSLPEAMWRLVQMMDVYDKFGSSLPYQTGFADTECQLDNFRELVVEPLEAARQAGDVRADLTEGEVILACRMVASGWRLDLEPDRDAALTKRFKLIMQGLRPD